MIDGRNRPSVRSMANPKLNEADLLQFNREVADAIYRPVSRVLVKAGAETAGTIPVTIQVCNIRNEASVGVWLVGYTLGNSSTNPASGQSGTITTGTDLGTVGDLQLAYTDDAGKLELDVAYSSGSLNKTIRAFVLAAVQSTPITFS